MFITDYIKVYENAIPLDLCDEVIKRFDAHVEVKDEFEIPEGSDRPIRSYQELVISKDPGFQDVQAVMMKIAELAIGKYQAEVPIKTFPKEIGCELYRVQKFRAGETPDFFEYHVDVNNYASARRFLTLYWFLNDVEKGAEIYFPHPNIRVRPQKGRLVIYPANWLYPTEMARPVSVDRYTISTYLHYI